MVIRGEEAVVGVVVPKSRQLLETEGPWRTDP